MEGPERYVMSVVLESPPTHKAEPIPRHCGVCPPVWLRKLDPDTHPAEVPGWVLHQNATSCSECGPEHPHYQHGPVRATAEAQQEGSSKEDEAGRPLPQTSGAPGQQAGPMGTNAWASIARPSRDNVHGHPEERCGS